VEITSYWVQARSLAKGRFARHALTLSTGVLLGNGLIALVSPIMTRLYSPADLGRFGLYTSFIGIASVATTMRYEFAIVAATSQTDAFRLSVGTLALALPMSLVLSAAL
jgi:O-antigen/teichoic acid export membrane protein